MAEIDQPSMLLAEILSDLVSLRVCDPKAALALVSARPGPSTTQANATATSSTRPEEVPKEQDGDLEEQDVDLKRAKELVHLHYEVREKHRRGELGGVLREARESVRRAGGG